MSHVSDELETKTRLFWELSSSYNNRIELPIPYQTAVKTIEDILDYLDPQRPLAKVVRNIEHELVYQDISPPSIEPASITPLSAYRS